jgi:hypothetical protein
MAKKPSAPKLRGGPAGWSHSGNGLNEGPHSLDIQPVEGVPLRGRPVRLGL